MDRIAPRRLTFLALASGLPALVYEVAWTREVALLVGGQIEAISAVLVAFFGGLALGAPFWGAIADRCRSPLRLYAALELGASALGAASIPLLRALDSRVSGGAALGVAAVLLLPVSFALGGTLPALLRAAGLERAEAAARAGRLVAANTGGAVLGVAVALVAIPALGLRITVWGAATVGAAIGAVAFLLARVPEPPPDGAMHPAASDTPSRREGWILAAAALAGVSTLGWEVVSARFAMLWLGSSLVAWGAVLALFLAGLALGNAAFARRAARSEQPALELGALQLAAALALGIAGWILTAGLGGPARGAGPGALLAVGGALAPGAFAMGASFPFFVRLGLGAGALGGRFGAISGANTAGGIAGALLAPFVLVPALGLVGAVGAFVALHLALAAFFLTRAELDRRLGIAAALAGVGALSALALGPAFPEPRAALPIHVEHGRQVSVVVAHWGDRRDLIVDGEPEASTRGAARRTEELLALLPMLLHPEPKSFLEIGFGSGITLGAAARFPLEEIHCVELAGAVLRAAPFFAPDNGGVADGSDPRVRITRRDARVFLAELERSYDVIVANTLHPWSVGATGLYSQEYFSRVASALAPDGIAVQWLPLERIGGDALALILRTWLAVFPESELWWGDRNLLVVGRQRAPTQPSPLVRRAGEAAAAAALARLGIADAREFEARRLADAEALRQALGRGAPLRDDRPRLEWLGASPERRERVAWGLLAEIVTAAAQRDASAAARQLWVEGEIAAARGDTKRAAGRNALAIEAGSPLARESRVASLVGEGHAALARRDFAAADRSFTDALAIDPQHRGARHALAYGAVLGGDPQRARAELETLLAAQPDAAEAWGLLGEIAREQGGLERARTAFERALAADPHFPQALAGAGGVALEQGDLRRARAMLARLRALTPLGTPRFERELADAIGRAGG